jgi:hypothetical protein
MGTTRSFPALGFDPAPGDVAAVSALGEALDSGVSKIGDAHDSMGGLGPSADWTGEAADGFGQQSSRLAGGIGAVHTAMTGAGKLIGQWASELGSFQSSADQLEAEAAKAMQQVQTAQSNPAMNLVGSTFTDQASAQAAQQQYQAANGQMQAAQGQLDAVREQGKQLLQQHGQAAQSIAGGISGMLGQAGFAVQGPSASGGSGVTYGPDGTVIAQAAGQFSLASGTAGGQFAAGGVSGSGQAQGFVGGSGNAYAFNGPGGFGAGAAGYGGAFGSVKGSVSADGVTGTGSAEGFVGAVGGVKGGFSGGNAYGAASGEIGAGGKVELDGSAGAISGGVGASGFVGGRANANASVGQDGINVSTGAFVGAEVSETAHADVGGFGVSATGGASIGYGDDAGFHANRDSDGTYHLGGNAGGSFIAGGSAAVDLSFNPHEFDKTAQEVGNNVGGVVGAGIAGVGKVVDDVLG